MLLIRHIKSKELSDCVYKTFKHFHQPNEYNKIGSLILMSLDKVVEKKKDELRDLNSQLKNHINDLNASMCAL